MEPSPADRVVAEGRDVYLEENGFTVAGYDEPWTHASFFALDFVVPNTRRHAQAIRLHDLHHVATGFGTDLVGEAEISAWELRGGLRGLGLYVSSIIVGGALMGLFVAPRRTWSAWRRGRGARALWTLDVSYESLLRLRVGDLRALVGVDPSGVARGPRGLHKNAPRFSGRGCEAQHAGHIA